MQPDQKENLKVKISSPHGDLTCNGKPDCVVAAKYIDKNQISFTSLPKSKLSFTNGTEVPYGSDVYVDVSIDGNHFTDNKIPIYYYFDPEF